MRIMSTFSGATGLSAVLHLKSVPYLRSVTSMVNGASGLTLCWRKSRNAGRDEYSSWCVLGKADPLRSGEKPAPNRRRPHGDGASIKIDGIKEVIDTARTRVVGNSRRAFRPNKLIPSC